MLTRACQACGAQISFIKMVSGRWEPVDPELVKTFMRPPSGDKGPPLLALITERGAVVRGREASVTDAEAESVEGDVSHFLSCTDPKRFRR